MSTGAPVLADLINFGPDPTISANLFYFRLYLFFHV